MVPGEGEGRVFHASNARIGPNDLPWMAGLITAPWMVP